MENFIKNQIVRQANVSEELGKDKYTAYFINTSLYEKYRAGVDALLIEEGYGNCIIK